MTEAKTQAEVTEGQSQLVIFCLGEEEYGIDINQVREIIRPKEVTPVPKAPAFIDGVINLRGRVIPVLDLRKRFELASRDDSTTGRIVVVDISGQEIGMRVDQAKEVTKLDSSKIGEAPDVAMSSEMKEAIKGVGKLEGRLIILLNLDKILPEEEVEEVKKVKEG